MKTLAIMDICDGSKTIYEYNPDLTNRMIQKDVFDNKRFKIKKVDRIIDFFNEIKNVGNIVVYLINGNKKRKLFTRIW